MEHAWREGHPRVGGQGGAADWVTAESSADAPPLSICIILGRLFHLLSVCVLERSMVVKKSSQSG